MLWLPEKVMQLKSFRSNCMKVRKAAKIRNWYNQVPHLTQDTTWESDKNTNINNRSQEVRPFPAGEPVMRFWYLLLIRKDLLKMPYFCLSFEIRGLEFGLSYLHAILCACELRRLWQDFVFGHACPILRCLTMWKVPKFHVLSHI